MTMWKPGTSKPPVESHVSANNNNNDDGDSNRRRSPEKPDNNNNNNNNNDNSNSGKKRKKRRKPASIGDNPNDITANSSNKSIKGASPPTKKLSGTTLGMRFMKRNASSSSTTRVTPNKQVRTSSASQKTNRAEQQQQQSDEDDDPMQVDNEEEHAHHNGDVAISSSHLATTEDMYGSVRTNLIGRRSFGGFRKSVEANWNDSWQSVRDNENSEKRRHLSDEELVERYKDYARGRDGSGLEAINQAEAAPIGNLQGKLQKKNHKKRKHPIEESDADGGFR